MNSFTIQTKGGIYTSSQLPEPKDDSFEGRAILFCRQWVNGQTSFSLTTSGSTGTPKVIQATRDHMKQSALATARSIGLKSGQTSLVCLDPNYIAGRMMLVRSMEVGMNIFLAEPSANPFSYLSSNSSIDFVALVPYQVQTILQSKEKSFFNSISNILIGGAPLSQKTENELQQYQCQFYETYGMTETLSHIALRKVNGSERSEYFQTLPNVGIRVDERQCLCIQVAFLEKEIITNDVVELRNGNSFKWLGRLDHVINSGGIKLHPEEIEKKIALVFELLGLTNRFFIAGLPDGRLGTSVHLIIEGELTVETQNSITHQIESALSKYEIPKSIRWVRNFVETATQKVDRKKTILSLE
ncbi:MAG: AMP-binding protein [Cyclobacteriaceae bacterium]|jgi:O-succinylbenzoic acid--CoA ligase|nr:AMP-binding protein [Flammeovirgaceae bacterium]